VSARLLRVAFGTDFHGSEVCFRKMFNLAFRARADVIVLGGDVCGKGLVPIVRHNGVWGAELGGRSASATTEAELAELEHNIRFGGFYPLRVEPDELAELERDPAKLEAAFEREMVRSIERWLEIAEEKLAGSEIPCVSLPGNDDDWAIDTALASSTRVRNCDGVLLDFADVQILGFGASNHTPWDSPRELGEDEIGERLRAVAATVDPDRPLIANIHVPPYDSGLDEAPMLDDKLRSIRRGGSALTAPVGSTAVREWVEQAQPWLSLHGHVHECRRATRLGETLAINPGSDYASGTLQAVVVTLDLKKRRAKGHQFVSG
jgi:uncharacterized protein